VDLHDSRTTHKDELMFWDQSLSVFSAPTNYGVVKIAYLSSEVVLRMMKHSMIYPGSDISSEVIALHSVV
jgi:hypothetical protein